MSTTASISRAAVRRSPPTPARTRRRVSTSVTVGSERLGLVAKIDLLDPMSGEELDFTFADRNRRPPRDPVNALLSFAYALLVKDCTVRASRPGWTRTSGSCTGRASGARQWRSTWPRSSAH